MIGSGAYVFESVDEARTVTLKANEDYWGGAPTFKTVVIQAPVDSSTSLVALQNGEVNCVSMMEATAVETAREDANLNVVEFEAWGQQMLGVLVGDQRSAAPSSTPSTVRISSTSSPAAPLSRRTSSSPRSSWVRITTVP